MRRLAALGLAATLVSWEAGPALAQSAVSYPASSSPADLAGWLKRETPLNPAQVVDVATSAVTAVVSSQPTKDPRGFIAILHAEALDPGIQAEEGIVSWSIPVELDCARRRVRLGPMTGFPGRDIHTSPKPIRDADADWVAPAPKAPLDSALRAMCDPHFHHPLADVKIAAQTAEPPPKAAPIPVAPAPVPKVSAPPAATMPTAPAPRPAPPPSPGPRKPTARTPAATGSVSTAVQVGASPTQADIKTVLAKLQKKFAGDLKGLKSDAVAVTVDGKTIYRGLITGFHTAAEAASLCETLKAGGQACFVRK